MKKVTVPVNESFSRPPSPLPTKKLVTYESMKKVSSIWLTLNLLELLDYDPKN